MVTDPPPTSVPSPPREERRARRTRTSALPMVGLSTFGGAAVHATMRDISASGAGLARRGRLDLPTGTSVQLEIHEPGSEKRHHISAKVRWSRFAGFNTYIGVRFDSPLPANHPLLQVLMGPGQVAEQP
jgi:hypothetical protein